MACLVAVVAAAIVCGALTLVRPTVPSEAPAGAFSADRALEHVTAIAREPHPIGSAANRRVREYLMQEVSALGLTPELQRVEAPDYFGSSGRSLDVVNVMTRIPGVSSLGTVLLMAHYDTAPTTQGANDNSVGVAVLLETGRALLAAAPLSNDVVLLFTDGEEPAPQYGATAFVAHHPWMDEIAFVINLEAAAGSGPVVLVQTGEAQAWTIERVAAAVGRPVAFSFLTATVAQFGEIGTDFDPFLAGEAEGVHVAYLRGSSIYHTPRDDLDQVDLSTVQHHGDYALGLARGLGETNLALRPPTRGATFFTVFPGILVRYPGAWALPLALLAMVVAGAAVWADSRRGRRLRGILSGAGRMLLRAVGVSLAAALLWMAIAALRPEMGAAEAYAWLMILVVAFGLYSWRAWRRGHPPAASVPPVVWSLLAVAAGVWLSGAAYLFTWPALVAGVALVTWPATSRIVAWLRLFIVSAVTAVMLVPAVDVFLAMAQPRPGNIDSELTETFAVVALLMVLAAELIGRFAPTDTGTDTAAHPRTFVKSTHRQAPKSPIP